MVWGIYSINQTQTQLSELHKDGLPRYILSLNQTAIAISYSKVT